MKRYVVVLIIFLSACSIQPAYEPFHMEMLTYLFTSLQELELYCKQPENPKIPEILASLRKNSVWLKNHMEGLGIKGEDDYSLNVWKIIKDFDETYKKQGKISLFYCQEESSLALKIIEKGMKIEALRR